MDFNLVNSMPSYESQFSVLPPPTEVIRILGEVTSSHKTDDSLTFESWITTTDTGRRVLARVLVDYGATSYFVNDSFVAKSEITTSPLESPIIVRNADGSLNRGGPIISTIDVFMSSPISNERIFLEVTTLSGPFDIILGIPWLKQHNPTIDWRTATLRPGNEDADSGSKARVLRTGVSMSSPTTPDVVSLDEISSSVKSTQAYTDSLDGRHSFINVSKTDHARTTTPEEDMEQFVPSKYWEYSDIFTRTTFDSLPDHSEFDHTINLDDSFKPQRGKIYPLSPKEQVELDKFLDENLSSGRIRPSKSPQAAPFFFTPKMEEVNAPGADPGLRPIQDYRYLNSHTIKNRYPLPSYPKSFNNRNFVQRNISAPWIFAGVSIISG